MPTDRPQTSFGLGFVVTETVRAPEPVLPDPFIGRAPLPSEDVAASRDVPTR